MDFVSDCLEHGRRLRCLTIVDDFSRNAVDLVVDHGISGLYVTRVLDRAAKFRGLPRCIRTDQGPEFTGKALDQWAYEHGVELRLIEAGKPTQNAYVESFNGKFRDECLNEHWFRTLAEARNIIAAWRIDYNSERPHSAIGGRDTGGVRTPLACRRGPNQVKSTRRFRTESVLTPGGRSMNLRSSKRDLAFGASCMKVPTAMAAATPD